MKPLLPLLTLMTASAASAASDARVTLAPGQSGPLGEWKVTLVRVSDSRCPQGVMCVWAGELNATVLIRKGKTSRLLKLKWPEAPNTAWQGICIQSATPKTTSGSGLKVTFTDTPNK